MADPRTTPAMRQYFGFKKDHPDCLLFFRMGDFYETFADDAITASKILGLTLTERSKGLPMAGMPHHQLDTYLQKLVAAGIHVAVADQIQDPAQAKGIVDRAVTRVVTPGTLIDESLLEADASNRLASIVFTGTGHDSPASMGIVEVSTGSFVLVDANCDAIADELIRRGVQEVLVADPGDGMIPSRVTAALDQTGLCITPRPSWHFRLSDARQVVLEQFGAASLKGFGLDDNDPAIAAAGAIILYLRETQGAHDLEQARQRLMHLCPPTRVQNTDCCVLDTTTLRSLEVQRTIRQSSIEGSLLGLFTGKNACQTPMGKRLLREWLCQPLCDIVRIKSRHDRVELLKDDHQLFDVLTGQLASFQDVSRITARLAIGRALPRDLVGLSNSLNRINALQAAMVSCPRLDQIARALDEIAEDVSSLAKRIASTCVDVPPAHLRDGGVIRDSVDPQLDEARSLQQDAATWLAQYQAKMIAEHDLPGIKVGYNRVFGYYIELTSIQAAAAPDSFIRKQTLKNAERYITPELKEFEDKVLKAESVALDREKIIFNQLCQHALGFVTAIRSYAELIAELDVLLAYASIARSQRWVRPTMTTQSVLDIVQGCHPVLEQLLDHDFVPNDLKLGISDTDTARGPNLALITGPNMAGKSTFIRQIAVITLLAHAGSFVPAQSATLGLTDRIFTRVGADDAIHSGLSTFMVEMTETSHILHHATPQSLIILDEIGRGTSTLDGLSLAWAITENLAGTHESPGPRTLFATHYHELTELAEHMPDRIKNLHVTVSEFDNQIIFQHTIAPGRSDQSYGIHVAKLAGLPDTIVKRASQVLDAMEVHHANPKANNTKPSETTPPVPDQQMMLFKEYVQHPAVDELREVKIESLTPLQAFDHLRKLTELAQTDPPDSD